MQMHRPRAAFRALAIVVAVMAAFACSSSAPTRPSTPPNVLLMDRFDSLRVAAQADSDLRAGLFELIAKLLAEGAPVQRATISFNGHLIQDSAVAGLDVELSNGQPHDSTLFIVMWDGHGPDSLINVTSLAQVTLAGAGITLAHTSVNDAPLLPSSIDTLALTTSAPGSACASLFTEAPPDLNVPVPVQCQAESFSVRFHELPGFAAPDTVVMPLQQIQGVRVVF